MIFEKTFRVYWRDKNGDERSQDYEDEADAEKAEQWLKDRGATNIEVAAVMVGKKDVKPAMFPVREGAR